MLWVTFQSYCKEYHMDLDKYNKQCVDDPTRARALDYAGQ